MYPKKKEIHYLCLCDCIPCRIYGDCSKCGLHEIADEHKNGELCKEGDTSDYVQPYNDCHDLFSAEIRERVLSIKTWIRCMPELHDYQDGKISKGLLCERIQEQVAIYILKGLEGEV